MIREFAEIDIKPGNEEDFIKGVDVCKAVFAAAPGCHGLELHRSIEQPQHFVLNIQWDSVKAHEAFRASPSFGVWRGQVGDYFAGPPDVWHGERIRSSGDTREP